MQTESQINTKVDIKSDLAEGISAKLNTQAKIEADAKALVQTKSK